MYLLLILEVITGGGSYNIGESASGSPMRLLGTTNQITTLGDGIRTITYSIPSTFIAPGSIESTTTTTVGTDLLPTSGHNYKNRWVQLKEY